MVANAVFHLQFRIQDQWSGSPDLRHRGRWTVTDLLDQDSEQPRKPGGNMCLPDPDVGG